MVLNILIASTVIKSTFGVVTTSLWLIPLMLAAISYYRYDRVDPESRPINQQNLYTEYDFIIVGGGSAGAVVANRLSEVKHWKILLLEAGPDENEISDVPSLAAYLQLSKLDWGYKTEPSTKSCLGMKNNRCNWPRGKVLGGSSVLNYMLYVSSRSISLATIYNFLIFRFVVTDTITTYGKVLEILDGAMMMYCRILKSPKTIVIRI